MTPLDFIKSAADNSWNAPVGEILEALDSNIRICSANKQWEVLSYYYDRHTNSMVLDIEAKK